MAKKARLGRGLDALLGGSAKAFGSSNSTGNTTDSDGTTGAQSDNQGTVGGDVFKSLPVEFLQRGVYQPRSTMDEAALDELAASIESQGIVQPILVRKLDKDQYEIVAGERRWRAAQKAGLQTVPVIIREIPDETAIAVALIENIQRENLSALEEARGLQRLLDEFGLTHKEAALAIGRSRTAVSNLLRLLSLSPSVQGMLEEKQFEMGHARALLGLPEEDQPRAAQSIVKGRMSVRQTEQLVKNWLEGESVESKPAEPDADLTRLEDKISEVLGANVKIQDRGKAGGKVVIQYHSLDELDGIIEKIK